jgi:hypothetical protein
MRERSILVIYGVWTMIKEMTINEMSLPSYNEKVAKTKMQEKSYQDKNGRSRKLWQQCDDKKKKKILKVMIINKR